MSTAKSRALGILVVGGLVILLAFAVFQYFTNGKTDMLPNCACSALRRMPLEKGFVDNLAWSPDGHWLAFERADVSLAHPAATLSATSEIYTLTPAGDEIRQLTQDQVADSHPTWSPDGKSLIFASRTQLTPPQASYLSRFDLESGLATVIYTCPFQCNIPAWSPDGRWVAFQMAASDQNISVTNLWLLELETLALQQIATLDRYTFGLAWTSDSDSILFTRRNLELGTEAIYQLSVEIPGSAEKLFSRSQSSFPEWFPSHNWAAPTHSTPTPLFEQPLEGWIVSPVLSPNGEQAAFIYELGLIGELYVADLDSP